MTKSRIFDLIKQIEVSSEDELSAEIEENYGFFLEGRRYPSLPDYVHELDVFL